jgi:hypothetical protein
VVGGVQRQVSQGRREGGAAGREKGNKEMVASLREGDREVEQRMDKVMLLSRSGFMRHYSKEQYHAVHAVLQIGTCSQKGQVTMQENTAHFTSRPSLSAAPCATGCP